MEIELKRIGYNPRLDVKAFAANLFINGEKAATVANNGNGTQYYPTDENGAELVSQAEAFLKKAPGVRKEIDGKEQVVKETLEERIDTLFSEHLSAIERKKFDKKVDLMEKRNIVIGDPGRYMRTYSMKSPVDMLVQGAGKILIIDTLKSRIIPEMQDNEKVLNKNIPPGILKEAGLTGSQQLKTEQPVETTKKANRRNQGAKL